jgi:Tripartite tricarboxylate transporter TctB family
MNDRNLVRGLFLISIALAFGLSSLQYSIGQFSRAGPGLFPLMVSSLLLLIGVITVIRSRFVEKVPMDFNPRNIAIILGSLGGFALISLYINMILGITFMVFFSAMAGRSYSVLRNVKVSAGLIGVAFAFHKLLGLNLPLY